MPKRADKFDYKTKLTDTTENERKFYLFTFSKHRYH